MLSMRDGKVHPTINLERQRRMPADCAAASAQIAD
jgi:hypothetical protein